MMIKSEITMAITQVFTIFALLCAVYTVDSASTTTLKTSKPSLIGKRSRNIMCKAFPWYNKRQKRICVRQFAYMASVKRGVEAALSECRRVFENSRWNCSPLTWNDVFEEDGILKKASRESAFVQAITAAGVMHDLARECTLGDPQSCTCGRPLLNKKRNGNDWTSGGCSSNFKEGSSFSRNFMDPKPKIKTHPDKVKIHNHEVGRRSIRDNAKRRCKCHGTSSDCSIKTCWQVVPDMSLIADVLWQSYKKAVKSEWDQTNNILLTTRRTRRKKKVTVNAGQMTFIDSSPNYCRLNLAMGIMGTKGRYCDPTTNGSNSCKAMCCGRKARKKLVDEKYKCDCKFKWCCDVICSTCTRKVTKYTCQ